MAPDENGRGDNIAGDLPRFDATNESRGVDPASPFPYLSNASPCLSRRRQCFDGTDDGTAT
jgi:hypothetical protein